MVECELYGIIKKKKNDQVLIDTWWNVNDNKPSFSSKVDNVLIDTWWNVNYKH